MDAYSVFSAATAAQIKIPAQQSLVSHVQFLRELLDRGVLHRLWWIDTRDMVADGLTKGSIEREALHMIMDGAINMQHLSQTWRSPLSELKDKDREHLAPTPVVEEK